MLTYLLINVLFLLAAIVTIIALRVRPCKKAVVLTLTVLVVCTALFDSLIIMAGIVQYNQALTLGIRIGHAPIEDFFYSFVAVLLVPAVWKSIERKKHGSA